MPKHHKYPGDECPYCSKGSTFFMCRHVNCGWHYHTLRMLTKHEGVAHARCTPDCPACHSVLDESPEISPLTNCPVVSTTAAQVVSHAPIRPDADRFSMELPIQVRRRMAEEHESVVENRQSLVVPLPKKEPENTVSGIIESYCQHVMGGSRDAGEDVAWGSSRRDVVEVAKGIGELFEVALGRRLLYTRTERLQYDQMLKSCGGRGKLGTVYGVEHLMRLCAIVPRLVEECESGGGFAEDGDEGDEDCRKERMRMLSEEEDDEEEDEYEDEGMDLQGGKVLRGVAHLVEFICSRLDNLWCIGYVHP